MNTKLPEEDDDEELEQVATRQAARWWIRGHCGDLNPAERYALVRWCKTSPANVAELLHIVRTYLALEAAKPLHHVNEDRIHEVIPFRGSMAFEAARPRRWGPWLAAGALVTVAVLAVSLTTYHLLHSVATDSDEWRTFRLPDSTLVTIGPHTHLVHTFSDEERRVRLIKGEVLLQVAKDLRRPFLLDAGLGVVRATGTQFAVDRREHELRVTLSEGSVVVDPSVPEASHAVVVLHPGEELRLSPRSPALLRRVDTGQSLAWATRMVIFSEATIGEAAEEFNRRNRVRIEIPASIAARQVRGAYRIDDPESFVQAIATATKRTFEREEFVLRIEDANGADR